MDYAQRQVSSWLDMIGNYGPGNIVDALRPIEGLVRGQPALVVAAIPRFAGHFEAGSIQKNVTVQLLAWLARAVPGAAAAIRHHLSTEIYHLLLGQPGNHEVLALVKALDGPTSLEDQTLRSLARSIVVLRRKIVVVVGAGFSYTSAPTTSELAGVLGAALQQMGVAQPSTLMTGDRWEPAWRKIAEAPEKFQLMFSGYIAGQQPGEPHRLIEKINALGGLAGVFSFNWDDLTQRGSPSLTVVARPADKLGSTNLWQPHGSVLHPEVAWTYPHEAGQVFASARTELARLLRSGHVSHALVIGYREAEAVPKAELIGALQKHGVPIVRIRRGDDEPKPTLNLTAEQFAIHLQVYLGLYKAGILS